MGQTRNVLVHRLLCTNTIEERIMQILYNKQEEFNTFADESSAARQDMEIDSNTINNIMEEEIRRIREKYSEDQIKLLTC
jgi:SNF2 family DNA or RNA helicase